MSFSGAPSAFLAAADPDIMHIKNAIGWSRIPQALKDAEDVAMNVYQRVESMIDYVTNGLAPGLAAEITAVQNAIGFANLPTGWNDGTGLAPNNLYDRILNLEQRVANLEPF
jgi:hypothetical protein